MTLTFESIDTALAHSKGALASIKNTVVSLKNTFKTQCIPTATHRIMCGVLTVADAPLFIMLLLSICWPIICRWTVLTPAPMLGAFVLDQLHDHTIAAFPLDGPTLINELCDFSTSWQPWIAITYHTHCYWGCRSPVTILSALLLPSCGELALTDILPIVGTCHYVLFCYTAARQSMQSLLQILLPRCIPRRQRTWAATLRWYYDHWRLAIPLSSITIQFDSVERPTFDSSPLIDATTNFLKACRSIGGDLGKTFIWFHRWPLIQSQLPTDRPPDFRPDNPHHPHHRAARLVANCGLPLWDHAETARENATSPWRSRVALFWNALLSIVAIGLDAHDPMFACAHLLFCLKSTINTNLRDHACDSDSFLIAIDNCASRSITNNVADFLPGSLQKVDIPVRGIGGAVRATCKGTVEWKIEDDQGRRHTVRLTEACLNKGSPYRLLSPQHWAQVRKDECPKPRGTWCATYADAVVLHWEQEKYKRTIGLSTTSDIALLRTAQDYARFNAFCCHIASTENEPIDETELFAMPAATTSDDESSTASEESWEDDDESLTAWHPDLPLDVAKEKQEAETFQQQVDDTFVETGKVNKVESERIQEHECATHATPTADLLAWHCRLGHLPFARILLMAKEGDSPRQLLKAKVPVCAACAFGKATRRAWRTKAPINRPVVPPADESGAVVGVDQIMSSTPGLMGQMRGLLTKKRYSVTTVFVDHFSGLSCVHFQISSAADHTIQAKRAFERHAMQHGVRVKHCHADNHTFDSKAFVAEIHRCGQTMSYCGVNAHHANGKAEKKIRDLQDVARTMLLHAKQRWSDAITMNLWPFAVRMANDMTNHAPTEQNKVTPLELFSKIDVKPQSKFSHTFGSPVYALDGKLQQGQKTSKLRLWRDWLSRSLASCLGGSLLSGGLSLASCLEADGSVGRLRAHLDSGKVMRAS